MTAANVLIQNIIVKTELHGKLDIYWIRHQKKWLNLSEIVLSGQILYI